MRSILQLGFDFAVEGRMRAAALLFALLLASFGCAQRADKQEPKEGLTYRVEIEAPSEIAEPLRQGLNLVRWQDDPQMTPEQLRRLSEEAVREAREVAATQGYFSARADIAIDESVEPWLVRLQVEPGERTLIGEVDLRFTGPAVSDPEAQAAFRRVRETFPLRRGQPFRQEDWDAAKRRAVRELSAWRYAGARIADSQAFIDPQARRASLMVELESGPAYRFGEIRVTGVRRYSEAVAENLAPFRPGDVYDRDKLLLYQRLLLESGYFVSVQADVDTDDAKAQAALVRLAVIEAAKHDVEAGLGYSTDAGPRLELRYSNQDLLSSAWRFRSGLRLDEKFQTLQLDFDSPPRPGGRWTSYFARARQTDIQNEFTREVAVGTSLNWGAELTPSAFIVSGHLEEQRVAGDVTDNREAVYFGYRRTLRRTDDLISPRSGYMAMFEVGGAPAALASQQFLRGVISGSWFVPIGRRDDLLLRGQAGRVIAESREGIPSSFLFRTGGDQTVRGYAFESLGVQQGNAIVGGRRFVVASAEYIRWFGESWGLATFVDAGNAWDGDSELEAALGVGLGARFRTPIGPIRADIAYGEETGSLRLHFSVGYSF